MRLHMAMFLLDSRTPLPGSSLLEPMVFPKLPILFADFPYRVSPLFWAFNPRALMRFGTANYLPFHRAARLLLSITLHKLSLEKSLLCFAAFAVVSPLR